MTRGEQDAEEKERRAPGSQRRRLHVLACLAVLRQAALLLRHCSTRCAHLLLRTRHPPHWGFGMSRPYAFQLGKERLKLCPGGPFVPGVVCLSMSFIEAPHAFIIG